jgi:hypothetical protein
MDESERYKLGEYDDRQSAVAACKSIIDEFLAGCDTNQTSEELFKRYTAFGKDPWMSSEDASLRRLTSRYIVGDRLAPHRRTMPQRYPPELHRVVAGLGLRQLNIASAVR